MDALDEFKNVSGLAPSLPKSTAFFCNVLNITKLGILRVLPFEEGCLPVKYLGVPLVSSRLGKRNCKDLIEQVDNRLNDWKNKSLSIAGRLQLITSVISSMHVYWASMFILPTHVLHTIEQKMRSFLWSNKNGVRGASKVAWEVVCAPKSEGGLGIRNLVNFNKALMMVHIWNIMSSKDSLWVKWIHTYKLSQRNFWEIPVRGSLTWSWRKILQLRPIIRKFIWFKIGDGSNVSLWHDNWCNMSPLVSVISSRDIYSVGLSLNSKVNDVMLSGQLVWPQILLSKYPSLGLVTGPKMTSSCDEPDWLDSSGVSKSVSVREIWHCIRHTSTKVDWFHVVWFPKCIPRHAFNLWLIIKRRLKTQDLLKHWDNPNQLSDVCSLCEMCPDSHDHLFFECSFASQVWNRAKVFAGLPNVKASMEAIIYAVSPIASKKTTRSVIAKLVVAATAYFIWQERNNRLFTQQKRPIDQVVDCILNTIRFKLLSCRFKKSRAGADICRTWNIPCSIFI